ncbi:hypothetical protein GCM10009630_21390 [Kribbella jejuensis]
MTALGTATPPSGKQYELCLGQQRPPNAFATGTDVLRLEPGRSVTTTWGARLL